jgi:hypothetical protein
MRLCSNANAPNNHRICTGTYQAEANCNQDGSVNLLDVDPFIELISNGIYQVEGDIDQNGIVNLENMIFDNTTDLLIELGGLAPGTENDQLVIANDSNLDGSLSVELVDLFKNS